MLNHDHIFRSQQRLSSISTGCVLLWLSLICLCSFICTAEVSAQVPEQGLAQRVDDVQPIPTEVVDPVLDGDDALDRLLELPLGSLALERASDIYLAAPVLTKTEHKNIPAATTTINTQMIQSSGARDLNELLEIYVPNLQLTRHSVTDRPVGFRGIISDRDNKYFLRVNGRILNQRGQNGALSERDLPTLRDIDYVEVVRGPGAAIYGPGAIAGVINVVTYRGTNFEGFDTEFRQGAGSQYSSADVRWGRKLSDDSGVFVYYGVADVQGATQGDSPIVLGRTFTTGGAPAVPVVAGEPLTFDLANDYQAFRSEAKHKLHAQYTNGDFDAWFRWTRGGTHQTTLRPHLVAGSVGDVVGTQQGYQQFTLFAGELFELSPSFSINTAVSWDSFDIARLAPRLSDPDSENQRYREDELFARAIANWTPNEIHAVAVGFEYSYERFGLPSHLLGGTVYSDRQRPISSPWTTHTYSMFGEYQVQLTSNWTAYLTGRMDNHTYTEWLYSPRIALVNTPNDCVTNKIIASQSTRRSDDDELRYTVLQGNPTGEPETIKVIEYRHERQSTEELWWAFSAFYQDWDILAFTTTGNVISNLAQLQIYGMELEANYHTENTHWYASHGFSKLAHISLANPPRNQNISAAPFGFGNELNNWSNHITKFAVSHDINPCWSVDSSMQIYWGFPGAEDASVYNTSLGGTQPQLGWIDPGYKKAFRGNYYLNFGLENHASENLIIRADLYNVLGWIKPEYNKRNELARMSDYRVEAPAVGISMRYVY